MSAEPDPQLVREIARTYLTDPDARDELDYVVRSFIGYVSGVEHTAWRDAVRADADEAAVTTTATWPNEQAQAERDAKPEPLRLRDLTDEEAAELRARYEVHERKRAELDAREQEGG